MLRLSLAVLVAVSSWSCASHVLLPNDERVSIERELAARPTRFLRLSYFVTPFFGDATKRLLTSVPPEEVRLLEHPSGEPVVPGPVERVVPAGARVRIVKLELPTAWAMTERLVWTPRTQPWVYLELDSERRGKPLVLVLRQGIRTRQELNAELDRFLTEEDPTQRLLAWPESVRAAVLEKRALVDFTAEALEMAWGYPERKQVRFVDGVKHEEWQYPGGARVALLVDGKVQSLKGAEGGPAEADSGVAPAR